MSIETENELKFVLSLAFNEALLANWKKTTIRQGWLESGLRYREENGYFTTNRKTWSPEKNAMDEDEGAITEEEFNKFWPNCDPKLSKTRYKIDIEDEEWVVDFFYDDNDGTYFVMAEVEMPEGREVPNSIPNVIKNSIVFAPEKTDTRFTSKEIANQTHAKRMLAL